MSVSVFRQEGDLVDFTPATDTKAGDIVFRGLICGQVTNGVMAGRLSALRVKGVIRITKNSTDVFSVANGARVHWNNTLKIASVAALDGNMGVAVGGGANGDTYVDVLLNA